MSAESCNVLFQHKLRMFLEARYFELLQGLQAAVGLGVSASLTVLRTPREDASC